MQAKCTDQLVMQAYQCFKRVIVAMVCSARLKTSTKKKYKNLPKAVKNYVQIIFGYILSQKMIKGWKMTFKEKSL